MCIRKLLPLVALLMAGCRGCGSVEPKPEEGNTPLAPISTSNGLVGEERIRFHHLAEGSEVYPLSWLLALTNRNTNKPFLENPERFGLLPDPDRGAQNAYGLPVGLTVAETSDLRFSKLQMVGINCSACHVNDLSFNGERVARIDGAPNLFDLGAFYTEMAGDTTAVFQDVSKAWNFAQRLYKIYNPAEYSILVAAQIPDAKAMEGLDKLSGLREGGELEQNLADQIATLHKRELERPVLDLCKEVKLSRRDDDKELHDYLKRSAPKPGEQPKPVPKEFAAKLLDVHVQAMHLEGLKGIEMKEMETLAKQKSKSRALANLPFRARAATLHGTLKHFVETLQLLRARAAFLFRLAQGHKGKDTLSMFGRIDAFGGARNFIFKQNLALNAPISYPHLWNLKQIEWFHWDGNTTSLLERNVGQAIGLGAIFDPKTFVSTVLVENIEELEALAGKITPPVWPEKVFGRIDEAKRAKGEELFNTHCLECHQHLKPGGNTGDRRVSLAKIGTDPLRAKNFARPVNGKPFDQALSDALKKITKAAGGAVRAHKEWRVTKEYASRPLVAPWATAPYLHNNSVPTLYHLLLPAKDRPKTFPVGHREYDPVKLGYTTVGAGQPSVIFDTTEEGNINTGHEYGTDLKEADRMTLLEYLKSLR